MIIRATKQLLKLSRIPSVKNTEELITPFPGKWYANQVTRFDGKYTAIHFLHNPTRISVLVPGIEYHLSMPELNEEINLDEIEDIQLQYLFTTKEKKLDFLSANRILDEILSKEK